MMAYSLFQKGGDRPIVITVFSDRGDCVDVVAFRYRKDVLQSTDLEDDEEIRQVSIEEVK